MNHSEILLAIMPLLVGDLADHKVSIDLTGVDKGIAPFVIAMDALGLETKPSPKDLKLEILNSDGKVEEKTPTAPQCNKAWEFYEQAKTKAAPNLSDETNTDLKPNENGLIGLRFLQFHDGYRKGEVAGFEPERAKELLGLNPKVVTTDLKPESA